jgi:hypothetical protein
VLDRNTEWASVYREVRIGRANPSEQRFGDDRLPSNALVVGVEVDGAYVGFPVNALDQQGGIANDVVGGEPVVVIYGRATQTGVAYSRRVRTEVLTFAAAEGQGPLTLVDDRTGST